MAQDAACDDFDISLLPKASAPMDFKQLRPVAVLQACAKLWSRCMLPALQKYDVGCSPAHMGFRKAYSCPEFVATMRLVLARRMDWRDDTRISQIDFARAYDSVRHQAIYKSMGRRNVPEPLALATYAKFGAPI